MGSRELDADAPPLRVVTADLGCVERNRRARPDLPGSAYAAQATAFRDQSGGALPIRRQLPH